MIDTELFLDIIRNQGCQDLFYDERDGIGIIHMLGVNKKSVQIITTDDSIIRDCAIDYLIDLGLSDLIDPLFPKQ